MNLKKAIILFVTSICLVIIIFAVAIRAYCNTGKVTSTGVIHFSIDDTISVFRDLTDNEDEYDSIFDNEMLNFFRYCHEEYGAKFSLYCYYEIEGFNLSMVPGKYREEFEENAEWLQFGFHYIDGEEPEEISAKQMEEDYQKLTKELIRITGLNTKMIRLSYFKGSYEMVSELRKQGIECLLTADNDRQSYYLNPDTNLYISLNDTYYDETNDMKFVSSDLRLDKLSTWMVYPKLVQITKDEKQNGIIAVFTHEWLMNRIMFRKIEQMCKFAVEYGYQFTLM